MTYSEISHGIAMIESETAETLTVASASEVLNKALVIYRGVRPLLATLASFALIPNAWRVAIAAFLAALDELAARNAKGAFKAGKDL